jgi:hypothetical protein
MRDLINRKWSTFALRLFNWRLMRFAACLFAFQTAVFLGPNRSLYLPDEEEGTIYSPSSGTSDSDSLLLVGQGRVWWRGLDVLSLVQVICEMFVLFAAGLKFSTEMEELLEYGLYAHFLRCIYQL